MINMLCRLASYIIDDYTHQQFSIPATKIDYRITISPDNDTSVSVQAQGFINVQPHPIGWLAELYADPITDMAVTIWEQMGCVWGTMIVGFDLITHMFDASFLTPDGGQSSASHVCLPY